MQYTHAYTGMTPAQAYTNGQIDIQRVNDGYPPLVTIWRFEETPAEVQAAYWAGRKGEPCPAPKSPAVFRSWEARVTYRECGVVTGHTAYPVTMSHVDGVYTATVNGKQRDVKDAARILSSAQADNALTVTAEILESDVTPRTIGKAAAYELHEELGRLKYRDHYQTAAEVLGRPVASLAALTAPEAQQVRSYAYGQHGLVG